MYIIPGQYDILLEKSGFVAKVISEITILENETISLGNKILDEGDVDRNGLVDIDDISEVVDARGSAEGSSEYQAKYDFGKKGYITIDDISSVVINRNNYIKIEKYM